MYVAVQSMYSCISRALQVFRLYHVDLWLGMLFFTA